MSVWEYNLEFDSLARYAPTIEAKMEDPVHWPCYDRLSDKRWCMYSLASEIYNWFVIISTPHGQGSHAPVSHSRVISRESISSDHQNCIYAFPGEPVLEQEGNTASPRGRFISYLKARKMIKKDYIYHLVRVQDMKVESPTLQSISVVNEFLDKLPGLPPEREIELSIDILPDTQTISITPYRMEHTELRELKEQLRDLLEKGFIRPVQHRREHLCYL
ncbi:uncharacterized protein [Nicotiana tomentosiformis]|uniref:uncharacterized protein n=1 Tax=Nicotiana tomentosiformis TaxID=4098 RepID=UPI00388CAD57